MEIIYKETAKEETTQTVEMPKNFRQIGSPVGKSRLYIEDYVETYLKQLQNKTQENACSVALLGKIYNTEQGICVFVSAAIPIVETEDDASAAGTNSGVCFGEEQFAEVYRVMKEYFTEIQIVGWMQMVNVLQLQLTPQIAKTHRQFFPGRGKVFWLLNLMDKEEKLYLYERGELCELHGYFVYYEKNPQMQEYMIQQKEKERGQAPQELVNDSAAYDYRQRMMKKQQTQEKRGWQVALYAASAGVMAAVCILGVSLLNNYESMKQMQNAIAVINEIDAGDADADNTEKSQDGQSGTEAAIGGDSKDAASKVVEEEKENEEVSGSIGQEEKKETSSNGETQQAEGGESGSNDAQPGEQQADTEAAQNPAETQEEDETVAAVEASAKVSGNNSEIDDWKEKGYYIVQKGETLEHISTKLYQTTAMVKPICEANGIEDIDKIYVGQKLILP